MYNAIYYPYLTVRSEELLKKALLFWDSLDVIDPYSWGQRPPDPTLRKAADLVLRPYTPTEDAQVRTHNQILELLDRQLPKWFFPAGNGMPVDNEMVYANKFCDQTWRELEKRKLVTKLDGAFPGFTGSQGLAHLMMSILADNCASFTRATVTDIKASYDRIFNALAVEIESPPGEIRGPNTQVLTMAPMLAMEMRDIPIENLIRLRELEHKPSGHHYTTMRHKLYDKIQEWSKLYAQSQFTEDDRREVFRNSELELNRDFIALREELVTVGQNFVLSADMFTLISTTAAALATGGFLGQALAVPAAAVLKRMKNKYNAARYKALEGRCSSYLYLAKQSRFEQDLFR